MGFIIVYGDGLKSYDFGPGHPFRGDRFEAFINLFRDKMGGNPAFKIIEPRYASDDELLLVHDEDYIARLIEGCRRYAGYDPDTPLHPSLESAARLIVGGSITACESILGEGDDRKAFGIGGGLHHAKKNREAGFCLYNDVAVSASKLIQVHGLKRVLILDTDVHAGDGTAEIFYRDPRVLLIDIHQDPSTIYPGRGFIDEVGEGEGEGFTVNIPLPPGASDESYRLALEELFQPLAEEYKPDIIIRNGGSDPHFADMLGSLKLTLEGFKLIGAETRKAADKICHGRLVSLIGSGYNRKVLPYAWLALISGATGVEVKLEEPIRKPSEEIHLSRLDETLRVIGEVKKRIRSYWKL
ncbi:MAG: histone deacetylase [Candidatus Bathyarchaeia archaeon]